MWTMGRIRGCSGLTYSGRRLLGFPETTSEKWFCLEMKILALEIQVLGSLYWEVTYNVICRENMNKWIIRLASRVWIWSGRKINILPMVLGHPQRYWRFLLSLSGGCSWLCWRDGAWNLGPCTQSMHLALYVLPSPHPILSTLATIFFKGVIKY